MPEPFVTSITFKGFLKKYIVTKVIDMFYSCDVAMLH